MLQPAQKKWEGRYASEVIAAENVEFLPGFLLCGWYFKEVVCLIGIPTRASDWGTSPVEFLPGLILLQPTVRQGKVGVRGA